MDPHNFDLSGMNWLGFGLSVVAMIVIGFVWYAPWFPTGRIWMRTQGMDPNNMPKATGKMMAQSMSLMILGTLLMMFVYTHNFQAYGDAFTNAAAKGDAGYKMMALDGVMAGFFTSLGFIVPIQLNGVAFDRRPWAYFWVNSLYYSVSLIVAGILIATVGN